MLPIRHIDAALYELDPPKVTTLYGLKVPQGEPQIVRYDDGTGDELKVPLGTTSCEYSHCSHIRLFSDKTTVVSGATMFDILPRELKSLAVRANVRYAPHPYVWMAPASSNSTGLGLVTEGKELDLSELPEWSEDKIKVFPMVSLFTRAMEPLSSLNRLALEEPRHWWLALPGASLWSSSD